MQDYSKRKQEHKRNLSDWITVYDKTNYNNLEKDDENDILIDNYKECSNLSKNIHNNNIEWQMDILKCYKLFKLMKMKKRKKEIILINTLSLKFL